VAALSAAAVGALALIVLFGWVFDFPALTTVLPGLAAMKINTALGLLFGAISLWFARRPGSDKRDVAGRVFALLVAAIGVFTLVEYVSGIDLHIDQLFLTDTLTPLADHPGRMAAVTALTFILFAATRWIAGYKNPVAENAFVAATLIAVIASFLALLGYLFGVPILYHPLAVVSIALHTAAAFILLFIGLMATRPDLGAVALLRAPGAGGTLFRWLLPVVVLLPPTAGWLRLQGELAGLYGTRAGLALFTSVNIFIVGAVLWLAARHAERLDAERARSQVSLSASEARLRDSEQHYSTIVNLMQDGIAIYGNGVLRYANPCMTRMLGAEGLEALEGRTAISFIHDEDRGRFAALWRRVTEERRPMPLTELRFVRFDERAIYVELQLTPFMEGDNLQVMCLSKDVTAEREQAAQLRQSQKMEALGNLTGGMAHDFNNMLGVIIGNLDLLIEGGNDQKTLAAESLDAALRGADLTRRLLAFARRQPLAPQRIDVNELIGGMTKLLSRVLGEDVRISLDLAPEVWPVVADPAQLESAFMNLAANARDAMPSGGRLMIATGNRQLDADYAGHHAEVEPGDYAVVEVTDSGSGMPPEVLSHIFEPFFTTKAEGKGTGLGLAMVFGFMKQSGGHINVYSEPDAGTTFRLYLPRNLSEADAAADKVALRTEGGHETVLAVEDNEAVRRVLVRQLSGLGYKVIEVDSAGAALERLERETVDLMLTDVVMGGGMNGVELARHARERWPRLKIILSSGFPQGKLDGAGGLPGDVKLLSKPYRKEELSRLLREVLGA
jgi:two-component system cell cycle sensor histidine kinase/response regulator CckA